MHSSSAIMHLSGDHANCRVQAALGAALGASGHAEFAKLDFQAEEVGRVTYVVLKGVVSSYYKKQLAQACASKITGVIRIDNRIEVE